tara:strand:- start:58 stop:243 length:186 start_codon:yes stop_codon:yes gene_type:complete
MQDLMTAKEVAGELRVKVSTIRDYIKDGKLKALRLNNKDFRIAKVELEKFKLENLKEYEPI